MCMFSGPVRDVSKTKIFTRLENGVQYLVYSMNFAADEPVAMILPIPILGGEAPAFINFEKLPGFFDLVETAFPQQVMRGGGSRTRSFGAKSFSILAVEEVGSFEASFVPSMEDFDRLDERFRLPAPAVEALKGLYRDFGFVVFQLRHDVKPHPMAFCFPTSEPDNLFFPTVHVHDGTVEDRGHFDHSLYAQMPPGVVCTAREWEISKGPLGSFLDLAKVPDKVVRNAPAYKRQMWGRLPNSDTRLNLAASSYKA